MAKFEELLSELDKLKLPKDKYIIFGSGPLAVRGIRESKGLDIIVTPDLWDKLVKKYKSDCRVIRIGRIEIGEGGS